MRTCGDMVDRHQGLKLPKAAHLHHPFAILSGLGCPYLIQLPFWTRYSSKCSSCQSQRFRLVEFSGNHQHCVVRLIVLVIKGLQPFDGYIFNVRTHSDDAFAVAVPLVGGGCGPACKCSHWIVFAFFHFIADHCHLAVQILFGDCRVEHPVGFHLNRPA